MLGPDRGLVFFCHLSLSFVPFLLVIGQPSLFEDIVAKDIHHEVCLALTSHEPLLQKLTVCFTFDASMDLLHKHF